jgi:hypothetical protein
MNDSISSTDLIKKCNEISLKIGEMLFSISLIEDENERDTLINQLSKIISELSISRRNLSNHYFGITNIDDRVAVKAHLKYYSDILSELMNILKLYDSNIDIYDAMLKTYKYIQGKDSLINTHYMELAQKELDIIKDEKFKNLLEGIMDYKLFEREQREREDHELQKQKND